MLDWENLQKIRKAFNNVVAHKVKGPGGLWWVRIPPSRQKEMAEDLLLVWKHDRMAKLPEPPDWLRFLESCGLCRLKPDGRHVWLADQKLLHPIWSGYLKVALGLKLQGVCEIFVDKRGRQIDPRSVTKHGTGAVLNEELRRKLDAFFWPDQPSAGAP